MREDRRVKYTRMALKESLLELMKAKPIERITPTEICRVADINRNTFYKHYASAEALLACIESELYDEVRQSIDRSLDSESSRSLIVEICEAIRRNLGLCGILFSENGDSRFLGRLLYLAHDKSVAEWKKASVALDAGHMDLLYEYCSSGSVAVIRSWIQGGAKESPEDLAGFIDRLSNRGVRAFMKKA